ncbi:MAG: 50S ribosomal protein L6 [Acidimicrobiia bacterium]|nr:50S ribosomal protein L6 [Acidimicrobiia bacterium]
MSRIGNQPVAVPSGVDISISGSDVTVKGPQGTLQRTFPEAVAFTRDEDSIVVARSNDERESRALHGLSRALLANMVVGVTDGYRKVLKTVGVGYRAALKGQTLELQVGFSHPVTVEAPDGITFEVPEPTQIIITGIDKQAVGQIAADIRAVRPPEPYKGKGIRYEGEQIRRKAGKSGVSG